VGHHQPTLPDGTMQLGADGIFITLNNPRWRVDGVALRQRAHRQFTLCWLRFQTKVRCSVVPCNPPATGLTQGLFCPMTGAIPPEPALAKRQTIGGTRSMRAVERFPVHGILSLMSIFRSREDTIRVGCCIKPSHHVN